MQLQILRQDAKESVAKLRATAFRNVALELETVLRLVDRLNPKSGAVRGFMASQYAATLRDAQRTLRNYESIRVCKPLLELIEKNPNPPVSPEVVETRTLANLAEYLIRIEIEEYGAPYGFGKAVVPQKVSCAAFITRNIVSSGKIDIGLSVEPEGYAYAYFFQAQKLPILHVFADFNEQGGIDYRPLDNLQGLEGKRVLIIEDDVQTGRTLRAVLGHLEAHPAASYSLFLGAGVQWQQLTSVPAQISEIYINTEQTARHAAPHQDEAALVGIFGPLLFDKHEVFKNE